MPSNKSDLAWRTVSTIVGTGCAGLATLAVGRFMEPSTYGLIYWILSMSTLLSRIFSFGLAEALPQIFVREGKEHAGSALFGATLTTVVTAPIAGLVLAISSPGIEHVTSASVVGMAICMCLMTGLATILTSWVKVSGGLRTFLFLSVFVRGFPPVAAISSFVFFGSDLERFVETRIAADLICCVFITLILAKSFHRTRVLETVRSHTSSAFALLGRRLSASAGFMIERALINATQGAAGLGVFGYYNSLGTQGMTPLVNAVDNVTTRDVLRHFDQKEPERASLTRVVRPALLPLLAVAPLGLGFWLFVINYQPRYATAETASLIVTALLIATFELWITLAYLPFQIKQRTRFIHSSSIAQASLRVILVAIAVTSFDGLLPIFASQLCAQALTLVYLLFRMKTLREPRPVDAESTPDANRQAS